MNSTPAKPSRQSRRRAQRGFTLVEVMVALMIVALTLPALLFQLDQQLDGTTYIRDRTLAQLVVSNRLTELRLLLDQSNRELPRRLSGSEEMAGRTWYWSVEREATTVPQFSRIEVQVRTRENRDAPALYTLIAFLATDSVDAEAWIPDPAPRQADMLAIEQARPAHG